eukprot:2047481-Prymnesium_polylepis.1
MIHAPPLGASDDGRPMMMGASDERDASRDERDAKDRPPLINLHHFADLVWEGDDSMSSR